MAARAGIIVTGTEVLTGRVTDRNGPWIAQRLRELGVDLAHTVVVGDRVPDITSALRFMAAEGLSLIVTSGGLGPTADDLTDGDRRRVPGPCARTRRAARGADWRDRRAATASLAERRPGGARRGHAQTGRSAGRRCDPRARRHGTRCRRTARRARGTDGARAAGAAARAAADVAGGRPDPGAAERDRRGDRLRAAHAAAVRDPGVRDCRDPAARRSRRHRARSTGDHNLPQTRRGGGRHALRAAGDTDLRAVRPVRRRAPRGGAFLTRRAYGGRTGRAPR